MVGAAVLASMGAMRVGAGLVRLATVKSQQGIAARRAPLEVMTEGLPEDKSGCISSGAWSAILKSIRQFQPDILAMGPGLGQGKAVSGVVKKILRQTDIPLVLDADAIAMAVKRRGPMVATPHPGELARFLGVSIKTIEANREKSASQFAKMNAAVCLLKGPRTIITDGRLFYRNLSGNSGMASAGMGDVLTGIIAGLWGQMGEKNNSGIKAAALGAYVHGRAGDRIAKKLSKPAMLASDLAIAIPEILKTILRGKK